MNYSATSGTESVPESPTKGSPGRFLDLDFDKLRGGYYTQSALAQWMTEWAVRESTDVVLEPSCGDGAFLVAAAQRLRALGATDAQAADTLTGVEIVPAETDTARERIRPFVGDRAHSVVIESDFFKWWSQPGRPNFDVVVGNPPFIRYQTFPEPHRTRAMEIMKNLGMKPNRLTNIWVPFVAAAAASLKKGGRMALVLPAELLQVTYASQLRSFLTDRFDRIDIIACNELFFEKAQQEVVLLLAEGAITEPAATHDCKVAMTEVARVDEIVARAPSIVLANAEPKTIRHDSEKWLKYFLTNKEISLMRELRNTGTVAPLSVHASVDVGVVTGKNEFFVLNSAQVREFGLEGFTVPVVSRSSQLRGALITQMEWQELAEGDTDRVHLFYVNAISDTSLILKIAAYIKFGEDAGVNQGYKCSIRKPWYNVPSVWTPDALMFRQIYDFPRVVHNQAGVTTTDTVHRLRSPIPAETLIPQFYTHLTGASAEIEGRSYGGGVLELEPTEAERLLVPSVLRNALPLQEIDRLIRAGELGKVLEQNSRLVLMDGIGLSAGDCVILKEIWMKMRERRKARKRGNKVQLVEVAA